MKTIQKEIFLIRFGVQGWDYYYDKGYTLTGVNLDSGQEIVISVNNDFMEKNQKAIQAGKKITLEVSVEQ